MRMNSRGSLEGLPLQLLIAVVVTGIVITIVLGWLTSIEPPKSIRTVEVTDGKDPIGNIEYDSQEGANPTRITVVVYDQDLNPLAGALVLVQGCGVQEYKFTNAEGEARIDVSHAFLPNEGSPIGHLDISAEKSGYISSSRTLPVVRA